MLSKENGCKYIVLYQMLCLNTANNNGVLNSKVGEMIIPFDVNKIVRDSKYFDRDTVMVALELFKTLNLVYYQDDLNLRITNFDGMVGKESSSAQRMRNMRSITKASHCYADVTPNVTPAVTLEKEIDIRDKDIDKDKDIDNNIYTVKCHLNLDKKQESCLKCLKLNVCNKKTNDIFKNKYNTNVEDYAKKLSVQKNNWFNKKIDKVEITKEDKIELEELLAEFKD